MDEKPPGPGSYDIPGAIKNALPGFAPFTTTGSKFSIVPISSKKHLSIEFFLCVERTAVMMMMLLLLYVNNKQNVLKKITPSYVYKY